VLKWLTPFTFGLALDSALVLSGSLFGWTATAEIALCGLTLWIVGARLNIQPFRTLAMAVISLGGVAIGVLESMLLGRTYTS
jgi:hypothetical protein